MKNDKLFQRAEQVRRDTARLTRQLRALRELRTLEQDFRTVTRNLADRMQAFVLPNTREGLEELLSQAEEVLLPPPR